MLTKYTQSTISWLLLLTKCSWIHLPVGNSKNLKAIISFTFNYCCVTYALIYLSTTTEASSQERLFRSLHWCIVPEQECVAQINVVIMFKMPVHSFSLLPVHNAYGLLQPRIRVDIKDVLTPLNIFMTWASSWLHACQHIALTYVHVAVLHMVFKATFTTHSTHGHVKMHVYMVMWKCMYMYVYMYFAFKELNHHY